MIKKNNEIDNYISKLNIERQEVILTLRNGLLNNLPDGFNEEISFGMIGYVVPLSIYPKGYHTKQNTPLPFINLASQKNHIGYYHMGIYSMPNLMSWFVDAYSKSVNHKLDMGKSCIRIKKFNDVPYSLFQQLAKKVTVEDWIMTYESHYLKKKFI